MAQFYACDDTAFEELWWCRYYNFLFEFVRKRVGNIDDAADILQDVAFKVMGTKNRPSTRYNPSRASLKTWLMRIVQNVLTDYIRRRGGKVPFEPQEDEGEGVPEVPEVGFVDLPDISEEKRAIVRSAVSRLDEPSRSIIWLRFWEECTEQEIAKKLGLSVATVSRRLTHDLEKLRQMLS